MELMEKKLMLCKEVVDEVGENDAGTMDGVIEKKYLA